MTKLAHEAGLHGSSPVHAHITPDPETPNPTPSPDQRPPVPPDVPDPVNAPVEEPRPPEPPLIVR